jgi:hypothetical protein
MNLNMTDIVIDGVIASSGEARAVSIALREKGHDELAALWARFAEYLVASEIYVGPPTLGLN